ncbi:MAG: transcriptional repressor [Cytophagales bacterium]|nr:transcriptional repressor [Cytophagales bacterium]
MSDTSPEYVLKSHSLKLTPTRVDILQIFLSSVKSLTYNDISSSLGQGYDKVTIYRTLSTFEDSGIIHSIPNLGGAISYALCQGACVEHQHADNHIHFQCTECHTLVCLEDIHIPHLVLPNGYTAYKMNYLAEGICKNCKK